MKFLIFASAAIYVGFSISAADDKPIKEPVDYIFPVIYRIPFGEAQTQCKSNQGAWNNITARIAEIENNLGPTLANNVAKDAKGGKEQKYTDSILNICLRSQDLQDKKKNIDTSLRACADNTKLPVINLKDRTLELAITATCDQVKDRAKSINGFS